MLAQNPGGYGADQAGIQATGEQKVKGRVRVQTLVDAQDQLLPDFFQMVSRSSRTYSETAVMSA